ncbi:MAG: sigma-70 family RNA polymerase sigma factor [Proteobacteria bacterium]|nr:sigma-70 family RNA polymerase sigma factor [Pseudomonadota bacterium]
MGAADVTELVHAAGNGDGAALQQLFAAVYEELKRLASRHLAGQSNPTINTTGLVHETYLKLIKPDVLRLKDRGHFFATAAKAMRQIVIDHARRRHAHKRGGAATMATLDEELDGVGLDPESLIHLDAALLRLAAMEPALAELVELRFFAGLSVEQVAELRETSTRTVIRDWRRARAFLFEAVTSPGA